MTISFLFPFCNSKYSIFRQNTEIYPISIIHKKKNVKWGTLCIGNLNFLNRRLLKMAFFITIISFSMTLSMSFPDKGTFNNQYNYLVYNCIRLVPYNCSKRDHASSEYSPILENSFLGFPKKNIKLFDFRG